MPHIHEFPDGTQTGPGADLGNELHDHILPTISARVSPEFDGEEHVHSFNKVFTGPPIPVTKDSVEDKKKKKKKKKKKATSY